MTQQGMPPPDYAFVDHERLLADLQADDQAAVAYAYRQLFSGPMGRLVLTHQLHMAGVGQWRDRGMNALERAHLDGAAEQALRILDNAGFGPMSAAHLIAANTLEGQDHERSSGHDGRSGSGWSGPDEELGRDPG